MVRISWVWVLGIFLASCAGFKDWHEYERYQAPAGFSREEYEKRLTKTPQAREEKKNLYEEKIARTVVKLLGRIPAPVRTPDDVLRVLILPYVDDQGTFNSAKYVFIKVDEGRWLLDPRIKEEDPAVRTLTPLEEKTNDDKQME